MEHIKELMKAGDVKNAAEELKTLLAAAPDNAEAKMLYGTCCHLLGDDATFAKIHNELGPKMQSEKDGMHLSHWQQYHGLYEKMLIAALVMGAMGGVYYYGKNIMEKFAVASMAVSAYAGPEYYRTNDLIRTSHTAQDRISGGQWRTRSPDKSFE